MFFPRKKRIAILDIFFQIWLWKPRRILESNLKELIINRVFGCKASYPSYCFADLDCIVTKCDGRTVDKRVCIEIGRAIMLYRRVVYPIGDIPGRSEVRHCCAPGGKRHDEAHSSAR